MTDKVTHFHHEHHHHYDDRDPHLQEISRALHTITTSLAALHAQGEALMAVSQELKDAMKKVDVATTALGARFQALADRLVNDPSPAEVAQVAAEISADADKLNAIGADPTNPVPPTT